MYFEWHASPTCTHGVVPANTPATACTSGLEAGIHPMRHSETAAYLALCPNARHRHNDKSTRSQIRSSYGNPNLALAPLKASRPPSTNISLLPSKSRLFVRMVVRIDGRCPYLALGRKRAKLSGTRKGGPAAEKLVHVSPGGAQCCHHRNPPWHQEVKASQLSVSSA